MGLNPGYLLKSFLLYFSWLKTFLASKDLYFSFCPLFVNLQISPAFYNIAWLLASKKSNCVNFTRYVIMYSLFYFQAYKKWLKTNDITSEEPLPGLEHLNHDQLFYLNFAQVWCGSTRPEALRSKLKTAVHAPGKYRYFSRIFRLQARKPVFVVVLL